MTARIHSNVSGDTQFRSSLTTILNTTVLCSMATTGPDGGPHINAAYFAYDDDIVLYFSSDPATRHSRNLLHDPRMAVMIFSSRQPWGEVDLKGVQLFGEARMVGNASASRAAAVYRQRFPNYVRWIDGLPTEARASITAEWYEFVPSKAKILDEECFGEENYVTACIERSGPSDG